LPAYNHAVRGFPEFTDCAELTVNGRAPTVSDATDYASKLSS